jgi:hypothetical protein
MPLLHSVTTSTLTASIPRRGSSKTSCGCGLINWGSKTEVPDGGWTRENFRGRNGLNLLKDFVRIKNRHAARGIKSTAPFFKSYFAKIREGVISYVQRRTPHLKAEVDFGQEEALWAQAIKHVFAGKDDELVIEMMPRIRSVMAGAYADTTVILGDTEPTAAQAESAVRAPSLELCRKVTGMNDTLQKKMAANIDDAIEQGMTVPETVQYLRDRWPQIADNRIPTIARTEMGQAADHGVKLSVKNSDSVTHVSVVGCEAIEPGIPTYHGVPTCNIQNVPAHDVFVLEFHINHTGAIVPSAFRGADGSSESLPVTSGGAPENESASDLKPEAEGDGQNHDAPPPADNDSSETTVPFEIATDNDSDFRNDLHSATARLSATGDPNPIATITQDYADYLREHIHEIAPAGEKIEVNASSGGWTENGKTNISPNVVVTFQGKDKDFPNQFMRAITDEAHQTAGNTYEVASKEDATNHALLIPVPGLGDKKMIDLMTRLSMVRDGDNNSILTGFTVVTHNGRNYMMIGDGFYTPPKGSSFMAELETFRSEIDNVLSEFNINIDDTQIAHFKIETYANPVVAGAGDSGEVEPRKETDLTRWVKDSLRKTLQSQAPSK